MNYTLIIYKSDGCNTCRGCVMEQWGSDFSIDTNMSESDVVEKIAEAFTRPSEGGAFTAHLIGIVNGSSISSAFGGETDIPTEQFVIEFDQYSGSSWRQELGGFNSVSSNHELHSDEIEGVGKKINDLIRNRVGDYLNVQAEAKKKHDEEEKSKQEKAKKDYELKQLEELKKKYEGTK